MNRRTEPNTGETSAGYLRWWSRPDSRVAALSILLGAAALAVNGTLLFSGGIPGPNRGASMLWLPVLLVMFCITEGFAIHFRVRRGGHAISVTEIPMVLALFTIAPVLVVLARTVGGAVGLALLRRQRGTKLAFNTVLISLQATVAIQVFGTLARPGAGLAHPRGWLATYAAMLAADVLAVVLVTAAISLHDDPSEWRRLPSAMRGLPLVVVATSIALIGALAVQHNPWALTLLVIVSCVVYPAYRGHVRQSPGTRAGRGALRLHQRPGQLPGHRSARARHPRPDPRRAASRNRRADRARLRNGAGSPNPHVRPGRTRRVTVPGIPGPRLVGAGRGGPAGTAPRARQQRGARSGWAPGGRDRPAGAARRGGHRHPSGHR